MLNIALDQKLFNFWGPRDHVFFYSTGWGFFAFIKHYIYIYYIFTYICGSQNLKCIIGRCIPRLRSSFLNYILRDGVTLILVTNLFDTIFSTYVFSVLLSFEWLNNKTFRTTLFILVTKLYVCIVKTYDGMYFFPLFLVSCHAGTVFWFRGHILMDNI